MGMGIPQNGRFTLENPIKMIWGYPYFRKASYIELVTWGYTPTMFGPTQMALEEDVPVLFGCEKLENCLQVSGSSLLLTAILQA